MASTDDAMDQSQLVEDEEEQQEIEFEQLLEDATKYQAEYDEDREDQDFEDEEEEVVGDDELGDSLTFTKSVKHGDSSKI